MWLVLWGLGCADEVAAFADERAVAICAWHARCETLTGAGFVDEQECVTELQHAADVARRAGEQTCDAFDATQADACIAVYQSGSCDEPLDLTACDAVCGG